jgi:hypothetical protein
VAVVAGRLHAFVCGKEWSLGNRRSVISKAVDADHRNSSDDDKGEKCNEDSVSQETPSGIVLNLSMNAKAQRSFRFVERWAAQYA